WLVRDGLSGAKQAPALKRLEQYFWASSFTTNFDQGGASQAEADYRDLSAWLKGEKKDGVEVIPEAVATLPIAADTLLAATVKKKALLATTMALSVASGAKDFHTGEKLTPAGYSQTKVNSHHLFPKRRLADSDPATGIPSGGYSSELILNRALIDESTN